MPKSSDWFLDQKETDATSVKTKGALQISKVAPGSPAAALGLKLGDYLLSVNGQDALTANIVEILIKGGDVTYAFFLPRKQKCLTVRTQALPLGLRTKATSDGIVAQYKKGRSSWDADGVMTLWEREDYDHLRRVAKTMGRGGLLGKLKSMVQSNPIVNLLSAICEIETGNKANGYAALNAFEASDMKYFTSDINALVGYYQAKKLTSMEAVDPQRLKNAIWSVLDSYQESERMIALATKYDVDYPKKGLRAGTDYGYDARLTCLEGAARETSVPDAVNALKADQLQPICFMVTYRGNGPYDDSMKVYQAVYPHVKDHMAPMFVMTSVDEKRKDRPHWFETEEALIKAGLPITVAHDPSAGFVDMYLTGAPEFIAVNKSGVVVWDAPLDDDYAYWDMLSRANAA